MKISQHLRWTHRNEKEIIEILKEKNPRTRRRLFAKIVGLANKKFNESLKRRKGHVPKQLY